MSDRGPRGTSDWAHYSLELDVPAETSNINFGMLKPGQGKAWFDSLAIELDGEPFQDAQLFDLDFEGGLRGFSAFAPGYQNRIDDAVAHGGSRSLRIEPTASAPDAMDARQAAKGAREVLEELEAGRELLLAERGAKEVDWALHNARIVEQCMRSRGDGAWGVRDECMAENVEWILEQAPDARIVLWAHNGHIWRMPGTMGAHLAKRFGADYLPIGFSTSEGRYSAMAEGGLRDNPLAAPPADSIESLLDAAGQPRLVLDLRTSVNGSADSGWLRKSSPFRSIGALAMEQQFFPLVPADAFDVLVHVRTTTPAVQLDTRPGRR
jgi:erythromycin esterase-like protein